MNKFVFAASLLTAAFSCGPLTGPGTKPPADLSPPLFTRITVKDAVTVEVQFDEEIIIGSESLIIRPELPIREINTAANIFRLSVEPQEPGREYDLEMVVEDLQHNSTNYLVSFYGFNPRVPAVIINEFITNGSSTHPDMVELKILSDGNLGGVVLYQGTPANYEDRLIFPVMELESGDFILVHFKPQNIPDEINETADCTVSGGLDAAETAYDFWVTGGTGISGNNGVLALYTNPAGVIMDGVLYSNRTSASDEKYRGFGSTKVMERALELAAAGGWVFSGEAVAPEDAVNPEGSTSTRSICRQAAGTDTNSREDWHIVPSRMSTFGKDNVDDVFVR